MSALSEVMAGQELRQKIQHLRAGAAHARELSVIVAGDDRAQANLLNYATELERVAAELEMQLQAEAVPKASAASELAPTRLEAVAAMRAEVAEGSEDLAPVYRDRARRLRAIADVMRDPQQIQLLKAIAEDYEQLAARLVR